MRLLFAIAAGYVATRLYRERQDDVIGDPGDLPADTIIIFDADADTGPAVGSGDALTVDRGSSLDFQTQQPTLTFPGGS